jgi:hypothetical protein
MLFLFAAPIVSWVDIVVVVVLSIFAWPKMGFLLHFYDYPHRDLSI